MTSGLARDDPLGHPRLSGRGVSYGAVSVTGQYQLPGSISYGAAGAAQATQP